MKTSGLLSKDLVAGALFISTGIIFLWIGKDYHFGTSRQMGAGYFPVVLSVLLIALGAIVFVKALLAKEGELIEGVGIKGLLFVLGATFAFAFLIRSAGLPIATFVLAFIGSMASEKFRLIPSLLVAGGLAISCLVVFNYALGMPFPTLGYWFR